eukprot:COSAG05_NODE_1450_length_4858_cov_4.787560_8_plen_107_part_00
MTLATIDQHIGEFLCHSNGQVCLSGEGGTEISTFVSSEGYEFFSHKGKTYSVAEVICTAFHGPRPFDTQSNKPMQVDHIDIPLPLPTYPYHYLTYPYPYPTVTLTS